MKKTIYLYSVLGLFGIANSYAQNATNSGGKDVSSTSGNISYSIGYMDFGIASNSTGSINSGPQQPYEIFILSGVNNKSLEVSLNAFPNPTSDLLNIVVKDINKSIINYTLCNITGVSSKNYSGNSAN